jgi:hypothetical protein
VPLLPLLERPYAVRRAELRLGAQRVGQDVDALVDSLPLRALLETALLVGSDYWASLALDWLESADDLRLPREALGQFLAERRRAQKLRHRAKSLIGSTRP